MRTAVHFLPHDTPRAFHLRAVLLKGLCLLAASQRLMGAEIPLEERVLVVYNSSVSESGAVAKYYMTQRKIPKNNTCRIAVTSTTAIGYDEFETRVKAPVHTPGTSVRSRIRSTGWCPSNGGFAPGKIELSCHE